MLAFGDLQKYVSKSCWGFRNLGRWQSMLAYATEEHQTWVVFAYNAGPQKPKHLGFMYQ